MNQDKDVIDEACLTETSGALDDVVPIGGDYKETFDKLRNLLYDGYEIDRGDAILLNGIVDLSGKPRSTSGIDILAPSNDSKTSINKVQTVRNLIDEDSLTNG